MTAYLTYVYVSLYSHMKCSMDSLRFACAWKTQGIHGARISVKVVDVECCDAP